MTIKTTQSLVKIGSSKGVTLPAKELRRAGIDIGDELEVTVKKRTRVSDAKNSEVLSAAQKILKDYHQDFKNLAQR